jgi:hypothetical protein
MELIDGGTALEIGTQGGLRTNRSVPKIWTNIERGHVFNQVQTSLRRKESEMKYLPDRDSFPRLIGDTRII